MVLIAPLNLRRCCNNENLMIFKTCFKFAVFGIIFKSKQKYILTIAVEIKYYCNGYINSFFIQSKQGWIEWNWKRIDI